MIVAALCHDIAHPGQTNQFHIATQSELALCYNNISVRFLFEERLSMMMTLAPRRCWRITMPRSPGSSCDVRNRTCSVTWTRRCAEVRKRSASRRAGAV